MASDALLSPFVAVRPGDEFPGELSFDEDRDRPIIGDGPHHRTGRLQNVDAQIGLARARQRLAHLVGIGDDGQKTEIVVDDGVEVPGDVKGHHERGSSRNVGKRRLVGLLHVRRRGERATSSQIPPCPSSDSGDEHTDDNGNDDWLLHGSAPLVSSGSLACSIAFSSSFTASFTASPSSLRAFHSAWSFPHAPSSAMSFAPMKQRTFSKFSLLHSSSIFFRSLSELKLSTTSLERVLSAFKMATTLS